MQKKTLKTALKLLITGSLLALVLSQIDFDQTLQQITQADPALLLLALLAFNLSQMLSAVRLNQFLGALDLPLNFYESLRLYYLGMFYNLFLPGGIGGDGYKIWLLNKQSDSSVKRLIQALLLDRLSGLIAIILLAGVLGIVLEIWTLLALLAFPVFLFLRRWWFRSFESTRHTMLLSLAIQLLQWCSAVLLALALGAEEFWLFGLIFLASSVAAALPLTIGGIGAREITYMAAADALGLPAETGVAIALLFFTLTALSSLIGLRYIHHPFSSLIRPSDSAKNQIQDRV